MVFRPMALDALLSEDHQARTVWAYVEGLDLSALYEKIRAVEGGQGRDATDSRTLYRRDVAAWRGAIGRSW